MSALDYLRVGRAQTAAVEGAGFPLAAWVGGAPLWTLPLFALLGILAHFGGFGENGITDLAYDRLDPSKTDHPLVSGRLPFRYGFAFVYACQAAGIAVFVGILLYAHEYSILPVAAFLGFIFLGHAYNFVGKAWKPGAVLEISGAFALAFLACATAWTGRATDLVWAVAAYAFVFTAFQIAVAGELKELGQHNERNLLRRLGSSVGPGVLGAASPTLAAVVESGATVTGDTEPFLLTGLPTWFLAIGLSGAKALVLGFVAGTVGGEWWGLGTVLAALMAFQFYYQALLRPGPFDRPRRLRIMGTGEAVSYLFLVLALAPALWPWLWIPFVVLPVAWFGGMNRLLWSRTGSAWAPGV